MMSQTELIDSITVQVDALLDMRGVEKCRAALDIIGKLAALKRDIETDERKAEAREAQLKEALDRLTPPGDTDGETETIDGRTYRIGQTAEG